MAHGLRIKGHPIHPMLVGLPVTFYISTLLGDAAYVVTGNLFWYQLAWLANMMALGFGALAALTGLVEYFTIPRHTRAKRTANSHALLNSGILVLFLAAFLIRSTDGFAVPDIAPPAVRVFALTGLSLIGVVALTVAGWLGWELVYRHRVGVECVAGATAKTFQKGPVFNEPELDTDRNLDEERPPTNPGDAH